MRVLVSGGAGFIGSHIVEHALRAGLEVAVLDDLSSGRRSNVPKGVKLFETDLRDREATRKVVSDFAPELVSHQAAQVSVPASIEDPRTDAEVNVVGGINLLDACVDTRVRHLVFASSGGAIYGEVPEGDRASEDFRVNPVTPYGIHKLRFERLLNVYAERGLGHTVLRYANVYGPRQAPRGEAGVVAIFIGRALVGEHLRIHARRVPGDGGCSRDYVFVTDVARANLLALTGKLSERVLNVGSGRATTTRELARLVIDSCDSSSRLSEEAPRLGDLEHSLLDVTRFHALCGTPTPLAAGLRQTVSHCRAS
jgi:UDP-glucose 4-epimerase